MSEELKPCPFCGGVAKLNTFKTKKLYLRSVGYFIECTVCKNRTTMNLNAEDSIEAWNRRANDETD